MTTITIDRAVVLQVLDALEAMNPYPASKEDQRADALTALRTVLAREQAKPLTIERLRDALVASRIIPPAAVEDPDEYDDGVMLHRIEALHRRLT